ncbi:MAG: Loki-CTERM sorting domain-containing protein [Candidatus Hodarchaeales archaeon]
MLHSRSHWKRLQRHTITLEAIAAPTLGFEIAALDYTYNSTPSTKEVKVTEADKSDDSPGFELPILLAALSSMALIIVQRRRREQKNRS